MKTAKPFLIKTCLAFCAAVSGAMAAPAAPPQTAPWARVTEDERAIKIETDKLEAVIPKKEPKQWMTGITRAASSTCGRQKAISYQLALSGARGVSGNVRGRRR